MRPQIAVGAFRRGMEAELARGYALVTELERLALGGEEPGERAGVEAAFRALLERAFERLATGFEFAGLAAGLGRLEGARAAAREAPLATVEHPGLAVLAVPALDALADAYEGLAACLGDDGAPTGEAALPALRARELLRQLLVGTPRWIAEQVAIPSSDGDVLRALHHRVLRAFPDAVRDETFAGQRVPLAVPSVGVAVEYRFCADRSDVPRQLGGLGEELFAEGPLTRGILVLYGTTPLRTATQLRAERQRARLPERWEVLFVAGSGERRAPSERP